MRKTFKQSVFYCILLTSFIFADSILKYSGETLGNVSVTEITSSAKKPKQKLPEQGKGKTQIPKTEPEKDFNYLAFSGGLVSLGSSLYGFNFFFHGGRLSSFEDDQWIYLWDVGIGPRMAQNLLIIMTAVLKLQWGFRLPNPDYAFIFGFSPKLILFPEFNWGIEPLAGILYDKKFFVNLGFNTGIIDGDTDAGLSITVGCIDCVISKETKEKSKVAGKRYLRSGIEISMPVYRSAPDFFDKGDFPYSSFGGGFLTRIGPEPVYLTTGFYVKYEYWKKKGAISKDFNAFGIHLGSLPLLDVDWGKFSAEIPAFLSFGSGQIRFTGGALFDFYLTSNLNVEVSEDIPLVGGSRILSANDAETLEDRFDEVPTGNMYWVLGFDFDIFRHWGIGAKYLFHFHAFGEEDSYKGFVPNKHQVRVSTYLVF